jgi:hypothetical protein
MLVVLLLPGLAFAAASRTADTPPEEALGWLVSLGDGPHAGFPNPPEVGEVRSLIQDDPDKYLPAFVNMMDELIAAQGDEKRVVLLERLSRLPELFPTDRLEPLVVNWFAAMHDQLLLETQIYEDLKQASPDTAFELSRANRKRAGYLRFSQDNLLMWAHQQSSDALVEPALARLDSMSYEVRQSSTFYIEYLGSRAKERPDVFLRLAAVSASHENSQDYAARRVATDIHKALEEMRAR